MDVMLNISIDTLLAASPMLGHKLEDRSRVRNSQDLGLIRSFQQASAIPLSNDAQKDLFLVAPLDILVEGDDGHKRFHIIETNGTGIGGLTNMPGAVIQTVLDSLAEMAGRWVEPNPLVLIGVSGLESSKHPR